MASVRSIFISKFYRMKKKIVVTLFLLLLTTFVVVLLIQIGHKVDKLNTYQEKSNSLNVIKNELNINVDNIHKTTVILYYSAQCDICKWQLDEISQHINIFRQTNLYLISVDSSFNYLSQFNLQQFHQKVNSDKLHSVFSGGVPQIYIYMGDELVMHFSGETSAKSILKAMKNE